MLNLLASSNAVTSGSFSEGLSGSRDSKSRRRSISPVNCANMASWKCNAQEVAPTVVGVKRSHALAGVEDNVTGAFLSFLTLVSAPTDDV